MVDNDSVAVSAPGKVFLAGGYLVLDRAYTGLIFGLDARIHVIVEPIPTRNGVVLSEIEVRSPQFENAVWEYGYRLSESGGGFSVTQLRVDADLNLNRNVFIETTLGYTLSYIAAVSSTPNITPACVTVLADNDYYSAPSDLNANNANTTQRFQNFGVPLPKAHKTGLGSSAALVTSFTAAFLSYYLPKDIFDITTEEGLRKLHNLAQASHCAAQGKVGSGFDVASAVYGSNLYRRFSPSILSQSADPGTPGFLPKLKELVDGEWDVEINRNAVRVPKGLRLVMCDVRGGSQTPGMVRNVLAWRKENPGEADAIWADLQEANEGLGREMKAMAESQDFGLERLRACFSRIRALIRLMSEKSGVPIEPRAQTELLDACQQIEGVVGGVVPGAGGFDAITLLIEDKDSTVKDLDQLLRKWEFVSEQGKSGGKVSMLGVREEMEGVRGENVESYKDWLL